MLRVITVAICTLAATAFRLTERNKVTDSAPCPAVSGGAAKMLELYRFADTTTDAGMQTWRLSVGLSAVPVSQVVSVSDTTICRRAVTAYNNLFLTDSLPTSIAVNLLKYGTTRYIIGDPDHIVGEWSHELVVDTAFNQIAVAAR